MKRFVALILAVSTATSAFAQADGSATVDAPQAAEIGKAAPHQVAGPVHIRFRKASDITLVAGTDETEVRRELAYHAALRSERADD
jgi:hypothetical protein